MANRIDELLQASWGMQQITPAEQADDATFLRRLSLDLNGITPTVMEVREFLNDDRPNKRRRLIERSLQSPRYATHMANLWRDILVPTDIDPGQLANAISLQNWLREQFADNVPYDAFVANFLSESDAAGPGLFYTTLELKPEKLAARTSQVFLGIQMQCAECHDHPFDDWSQEDFWGYAAFFAQLEPSDPMRRPNVPQGVIDLNEGEVTVPGTDTVVPPRYPGGRLANAAEGGSRRLQLSIWMASRDNPFLPRAAVNRAWGQMFGRGLVEPIDDMSLQHTPSHPELLDELADYFARTGFDLRNLYRTLALTQAYQLSSAAPRSASGTAPDTEENNATQRVRGDNDRSSADEFLTTTRAFARMNVKTLRADQIYDSLKRFLSASTGRELIPGTTIDERRLQFVDRMRSQTKSLRDYERGAAQALMMMNGGEAREMTSKQKRHFTVALMSPLLSDDDRIDAIFLASISRFPNDAESETVQQMLDAQDGAGERERPRIDKEPSIIRANAGSNGQVLDRREVYGDMLWAIVNSAEFMLNH